MVPKLFQAKLEDTRQFEAFLNEFYANLDNTLYSVENFLSEEEKDIRTLVSIEHKLETTNLLLRMGDKTVNSHINFQPMFFVGRITHQLHDDGTLTEEQQLELEKVQEGLKYMKEGLYSEETGQETKKYPQKSLMKSLNKVQVSVNHKKNAINFQFLWGSLLHELLTSNRCTIKLQSKSNFIQ